MSGIINIVNKALKAYFADYITMAESDIGLQKPKKEWVNAPSQTDPKMNIYLFDIRENIELRNNEWQLESNDITIKRKKPDVRIDLFYMITFYSSQESTESENIEKEHEWISKTISVVYNNACIPKEYFTDDTTGGILSNIPKIPAIPVQPKFLGEDGGMQLWSALDQYLMPVIYLKVTIPISLAKYLEDAKVLTKILKFGVLDQKNYYTLNINPPVQSLVCGDTCVISKIEMLSTINYLDKNAAAETNEIILINSNDNIKTNDFIVIDDGSRSELCKVTTLNLNNNDTKTTLKLESKLKYFHPKGSEIKLAKVNSPEELVDINFLEDVEGGTNQFKVIGEDMKKLKSGDLVSVKNNSKLEYFFITAKFKEKIEIKETLEVNNLNN